MAKTREERINELKGQSQYDTQAFEKAMKEMVASQDGVITEARLNFWIHRIQLTVRDHNDKILAKSNPLRWSDIPEEIRLAGKDE